MTLIETIPDNSIDLVLCDPPYGIDFQSCWVEKSKRRPKILGDKTPFVDFIPKLKRVIKPSGAVMIFTRWDVQEKVRQAMELAELAPQDIIIWDKVAHGMGDLKKTPGRRYESILYHAEPKFSFPGKRPVDIVSVPRVAAHNLVHPNEKPVQLLEQLIRAYSRKGDVVLDVCAGSGSSCVAAKKTGRRFIGFELDATYFDIAKSRIDEENANEGE